MKTMPKAVSLDEASDIGVHKLEGLLSSMDKQRISFSRAVNLQMYLKLEDQLLLGWKSV